MIDHTNFDYLITVAVSDTSRRHRHDVEPEDVSQEIMAWWYSPSGQERLADWQDNPFRIDKAIRAVATAYAVAERAARSGYSVDDVVWYSPEMLEQVLPLALDERGMVLPGLQSDGQPASPANPAEGGNVLALVADVRRAYGALGGGAQDVVGFATFGGALTVEQEADYRAALRRMVNTLGGVRPRVPGRKEVA